MGSDLRQYFCPISMRNDVLRCSGPSCCGMGAGTGPILIDNSLFIGNYSQYALFEIVVSEIVNSVPDSNPGKKKALPKRKLRKCFMTIGSTYKPRSVRFWLDETSWPTSGQSSIWTQRHRGVQAAYPRLKRNEQPLAHKSGLCLCLALLLVGVAWPPTLLPAPVVSYTTFSPLPQWLAP